MGSYSHAESTLLLVFPFLPVADVVCENSIQKVVKEVEEILGDKGLNCLINNAGINVVASLEEVTAETMLTIYETNTVAQLMVTKVRPGHGFTLGRRLKGIFTSCSAHIYLFMSPSCASLHCTSLVTLAEAS